MYSVLIMMAGSGTRVGSKTNKVLLQINNQPVFLYSVKTFLSLGIKVILVINKKDHNDILPYVNEDITIVFGGNSRQESVLFGLRSVKTPFVLIHDAARPFISAKVIKEVLDCLDENSAVLVAGYAKNTIKQLIDRRLKTIPRSSLLEAATPQGGPTELFLKAHEEAYKHKLEVTDDISLIENNKNINIKIVNTNEENFKITTMADLNMAKLMRREPMYKIGHAWDTHRLVKERKLILGGIEIKSDVGLLGHSDADVVLHAISEALLGSMALGDLGTFFPGTEEFKDIDSKIILKECYRMVKEAGYVISNLDLTIYAEFIKIAPYRVMIQESIAKILQIDVNLVSVKATTHEKMGFIGSGEGIAAECVCLIISN